MAIQTTKKFKHDYATYDKPYFRLVTHLPADGNSTPVDCVMYESKKAYQANSGSITTLPFYVSNVSCSIDNNGADVVSKYLLYVTEYVAEELNTLYPTSGFTVVGIPTV